MAIVIEDGSIVSTANSYVTTAELATYAADRGVTVTGTASVLLLNAMDYIESCSFIGTKKTSTQPLQWPRYEVYIDGWYFPSDDIPNELKNGQMAVALAIDAGNGPLIDLPSAVKQETVGEISVTYQDGASSVPIVRTINAALKKLLKGGSGSNTFVVSKA